METYGDNDRQPGPDIPQRERRLKRSDSYLSPERDKSGAWSCKYEIDWPDGKHEMAAWGTDSVQAIFVAYQMIGSELYTSDYHKAGQLFFEAPGQGYGFPVPNNIRDLLEGDDARYL